jgi:hypothetical protein
MKATSSARQRRRLAAAGLLVVLVCICSALLADDAADVAPLIQDLKGANADARLKALEKLVEMGPKAAPAVQALIGVLDDPVEIHRDYAITTLKHIGPAAAPALAKLREAAAKDKSQDIRSLAQDAAEQIAASGGTATEEPPGSTFTPAPSNDDGAPRAPDVIPPAPPATPEQPGGSDPLAGSYRGDKLALVLVSRPQAPGQYSGTVALGEQQFPLSAHLDGQQILGTFQSGGKEFAFTLTVEGAKARFQTGRTTYSLAREQAERPACAGRTANRAGIIHRHQPERRGMCAVV